MTTPVTASSGASGANCGVKGFDEFSRSMTLSDELVLVRRFDRLSARHILHLQDQLVSRQHGIDEIDDEERLELESKPRSEQMKIRQANLDSGSFVRAANEPGNTKLNLKMKKMKQLEGLLNRYYKAIENHDKMMQYPSPRELVHTTAKKWYEKHQPSLGAGKKYYPKAEELACLMKPGEADDKLSRGMHRLFGGFFKAQ
ncbi:Hypothetical protein D9617_10g074840 [Elsinoe fawcettii]|nr:Hypothetical protein D9617_10g074840 [Elsinoe fawcettii]